MDVTVQTTRKFKVSLSIHPTTITKNGEDCAGRNIIVIVVNRDGGLTIRKHLVSTARLPLLLIPGDCSLPSNVLESKGSWSYFVLFRAYFALAVWIVAD